ncbi:MAG: galactitol-1-phosphate 5-dehydrogenase [Lachnospiraceae bacterium]|nr:galactitol-1-phosphate 5-dehydrogenase [Lachnospiraceae bacterium]
MNKWLLHDIGDIRYEDGELPSVKDNEVLIRVKAAGICGSDIPRIYSTGAHKMPLVPGHEFAGIIAETGSAISSSLSGKRVAVYPKIHCGRCAACRSGLIDMCTDYDYVGSRRDGAFAEYVAVPADNILILPEDISYETAAMMEPMGVAAHAVRTCIDSAPEALPKDSPIAVCGLGTIGFLTALFLKDAGFDNLILIGNKTSQTELAIRLGFDPDKVINSKETSVRDIILSLTSNGVSVYFECVGTNDTISQGLDICAPAGKIILVGNPAGDMTFPRDLYWKILRKQLSLFGIWNATFRPDTLKASATMQDDWHYVLTRLMSHSIEPEKIITHRFSISELEKGFHIMRDKTESYCKIMMTDQL